QMSEEVARAPQARLPVLFGMELYAPDVVASDCCREMLATVSTPRDHIGFVERLCDVAVRIVRRESRQPGEQRITGHVDDVPADVRHAAAAETSHVTANDGEPGAATLLARVEQQLHAEADAETRLAACDEIGRAH